MTTYSHKLRAFTIIETMVALVLTALAISFVYAAVRFVKQHQDGLAKQLDTFGEFNRLHSALQTDAGMANELQISEMGIELNLADRSILYHAVDSVCIRYAGALADTFRIRVDSVAYWFEGQRRETTGNTIDEGTIYVSMHSQSLPIAIYKRYDAASLIKLTQSTSHE